MEQKLFWKNLKVLTCPKCSSKILLKGLLEPVYVCVLPDCDFKIGEESLKRVVGLMENNKWTEEENEK